MNKVKSLFTIQDNTLIGQKIEFPFDFVNVSQLVLENLKKHPDFVGQIDSSTGKTSTYKILADQSIRCAIWLTRQKIRSGDIVCIFTENNILSWVPFLAIQYIGAVFNGGTRDLSPGGARDFLKHCQPKIIFTDDGTIQKIKEAVREVNLNAKIVAFSQSPDFISFEDILKESSTDEVEKFKCTSVNQDDNAWLLCSSGSTGKPKPVMYSYGGIFKRIFTYKYVYAKEDGKVFFYYIELNGNSTPLLIMRAILSLSPTVIAHHLTPEEFCEVTEKYKVQFARLGTRTATLLSKLDLRNYDLSSLNLIVIGGDKTRLEITKAINKMLPNGEVIQGGGMTEAGGRVIEQERGHNNHESFGFVCRNAQVKIVDIRTRETLSPNQVGELCYKTEFLMKCYYKHPKLTKEVIDSEGWLHSGDLGYFDEEGYIYFVERMKCTIKYKDFYVSAAEIENLLIKHPDIEDVAVVGAPHVLDNEHPMAFVVKIKNSEVSEADIIQLSEQLGTHKKLRGGVIFLETLPRMDEKIHRVTLKEMAKRYALKQ
ncbi:4-coumarate--CoA ligase-like 7 [Belonocnema kinseyi]|uniref:4-coumarate--CoA ligase-like 7 n=1 Tax=Belonocnema kinseyi TaxID=2817044 RepID=UPI00143DE0D9|nr:4-coumarate--CoA ligase-like 7 [Belonocnema kinseyi]